MNNKGTAGKSPAGKPTFVQLRLRLIAASVLGVALPIASASMGDAAPNPAAVGDISGTWWIGSYSPKLILEGGVDLPYNDQGKALYAKNIVGLRSGTVEDEARHVCVPDGIPRLLGNPYPFEIVHANPIGETIIIYELNHAIRMIGMDKPQVSPHELEILPYYAGHSVGHWEGNTMVVETKGFNTETFLDATGAPHSDQLETVERFRKVGGGKQLEDIVTITDPVYLTRPVTARFVYDSHPEVRLQDYNCGEAHRDISKISGVSEARRAQGL
jgi:hypothetical protein